MKGNKRLIITLIAALLMTSVVVSVTYSWLISTKHVTPIDVSTSKMDITISELVTASNNLPGESVQLSNLQTSTITNEGTSNAILQLSFGNSVKAILQEEPPDEYKDDYFLEDGVWYYKEERLNKVLEIRMLLNSDTKWIKIDNDYYAKLKINSKIPIGEIYMDLSGEFGGSFEQFGELSDARYFEHGTVFEIGYRVVAIQALRDAVAETWGEKISNAIPRGWYG